MTNKNENVAKTANVNTEVAFKPVFNVVNILGVDLATVFEFNPKTKKYEYKAASEVVGPGESEFYSSSAISIDPYVVSSYIGSVFEYISEDQHPLEPIDEPDEESIHVDEAAPVDDQAISDESMPDTKVPESKDEVEVPDTEPGQDTVQNALTLTCSNCGFVKVLNDDVGPGLQIILSDDEKSAIDMACEQCDSHLTLAIRPFVEDEVAVKPTSEKKVKANKNVKSQKKGKSRK